MSVAGVEPCPAETAHWCVPTPCWQEDSPSEQPWSPLIRVQISVQSSPETSFLYEKLVYEKGHLSKPYFPHQHFCHKTIMQQVLIIHSYHSSHIQHLRAASSPPGPFVRIRISPQAGDTGRQAPGQSPPRPWLHTALSSWVAARPRPTWVLSHPVGDPCDFRGSWVTKNPCHLATLSCVSSPGVLWL